MEHLVESYEGYNLEVSKKAEVRRATVDTGKIKHKMEKLKDLYLNDLIDRATYERDYTALRGQLLEATKPEERPPKPVDILAVKTALSAYDTLSRMGKKEFWCRIVGEVTITNDDRFFVSPVRHN